MPSIYQNIKRVKYGKYTLVRSYYSFDKRYNCNYCFELNMNTKECEKDLEKILEIDIMSYTDRCKVDPYKLRDFIKSLLSSHNQEIRDAINEIKIRSDRPENNGVADIYSSFWEETLKPKVLQILESNE